MAVIIPFKAQQRPDVSAERPQGSATILLYTGVRYERHADIKAVSTQPIRPLEPSGGGQSRRTRRRA